jgi:hypothetical protein
MGIGVASQVQRTVKLLAENKATKLEQQNDLFALEIERMANMHLRFCMF